MSEHTDYLRDDPHYESLGPELTEWKRMKNAYIEKIGVQAWGEIIEEERKYPELEEIESAYEELGGAKYIPLYMRPRGEWEAWCNGLKPDSNRQQEVEK